MRPDDENAIVTELRRLCLEGAALVLTAGGTGLGPRDRTPEATRRVIDREAPGLAEAMRAEGTEVSTLIVNLPGSKRGAEESLSAILPLLKHGIEVAAGGQRHPHGGA